MEALGSESCFEGHPLFVRVINPPILLALRAATLGWAGAAGPGMLHCFDNDDDGDDDDRRNFMPMFLSPLPISAERMLKRTRRRRRRRRGMSESGKCGSSSRSLHAITERRVAAHLGTFSSCAITTVRLKCLGVPKRRMFGKAPEESKRRGRFWRV